MGNVIIITAVMGIGWAVKIVGLGWWWGWENQNGIEWEREKYIFVRRSLDGSMCASCVVC